MALDPHAAFQSGVERLGEARALRREFLRAGGFMNVRLIAPLRRRWLRVALSLGIGLAFFVWHARVTPQYRATTTVELQNLAGSVTSQGYPRAEALNTALQILSGANLRSKVAASFTAEEMRRFTAATSGVLVAARSGRDRIDAVKIDQTRTVRESPTPPLGQLRARIQ